MVPADEFQIPVLRQAFSVSGNITTTMIFDDFKKHFELFSKIDTPEKLAICERQYKQHLLAVEDENYFEPVYENSYDDISSHYESNLKLILGLGEATKTQAFFLTVPSFEPESLLVIDDCNDRFILTYTVLVSNYWMAFYADNRIISVDKTTSMTELNKEIGSKIANLFYEVISDARPAKSGRIVLDGVKYYLSCTTDGNFKTVSKHSPNETSKPAKVIEILELLTNNINALDDKTIKEIKNKIDQLNE